MVTLFGAPRLQFARSWPLICTRGFFDSGMSMAGEVSYWSRFLAKFVEIIAAGLASAVSAYLLAHLGNHLLSTPAAAPPTPETAAPIAALPSAPAGAGNDQRAARAEDVPVAAPATPAQSAAASAAPGAKAAKALPTRKPTRNERAEAKSNEAEALARAALANFD